MTMLQELQHLHEDARRAPRASPRRARKRYQSKPFSCQIRAAGRHVCAGACSALILHILLSLHTAFHADIPHARLHSKHAKLFKILGDNFFIHSQCFLAYFWNSNMATHVPLKCSLRLTAMHPFLWRYSLWIRMMVGMQGSGLFL